MTHQPTANWLSGGLGERVNSVPALASAVAQLESQDPGQRWVWRGVPDATWRVQSSAWRYLRTVMPQAPEISEQRLRAFESGLIGDARQRGLGLDGTTHVPDLHLLASLQHHGAPTRLLDVTTSAHTALWFACGSFAHHLRDGALFAINVTDVPVWPTVPLDPSAPTPDGLQPGPTSPSDHLERALVLSGHHHEPFLVQPTVRDARMTAQDGLFLSSAVPLADAPRNVIDGVDGLAINVRKPGRADPSQHDRPTNLRSAFRALVIPSGLKWELSQWLEGTHRRSHMTLFPDLAGVADNYRDAAEGMARSRPHRHAAGAPRPPVDDPS